MTTKRTAVLLVLGMANLGAGPPVRPMAPASGDAKMFPDGRHYDFGKAKAGTMVRHTFRIVNTSDGPLEIVSVKVG
jgi:hypothetical protein